MKRIAMILIVAAAACGGGEKKSELAGLHGDAVLALGEATMNGEKDGVKHVLALAADGKITADGKLIGTLTAGGDFVDDKGTLIATLAADGKVKVVGAKPGSDDEIEIRADGGMIDKGVVWLEFGADGTLAGKFVTEEKLTITYTGAPETRRALAFAFMIAMFTADDHEPMNKPAEAGPAVAPTPVKP